MSGRVFGKRALVTGAGQGIGAAIAKALAREGAQVLVSDLNGGRAKATADEINNSLESERAFACALDVTREEDWRAALAAAEAQMRGLSVLVHNAGISMTGDIEHLSFADWRQMISVNLDSVFIGTQLALPYLKAAAPASIIGVSSVAALMAVHTLPAYSASKAGMYMLMKSTGLYCARKGYNVRCNTIHPTYIDTPLLDRYRNAHGAEEAMAKLKRQVPIGALGDPEDVAHIALYLASDESKFVTAAEFKVDGGVTA